MIAESRAAIGLYIDRVGLRRLERKDQDQYRETLADVARILGWTEEDVRARLKGSERLAWLETHLSQSSIDRDLCDALDLDDERTADEVKRILTPFPPW